MTMAEAISPSSPTSWPPLRVVVRGGARIESHNLEGIAARRREAVDSADVHRAVETGRALDSQHIELTARDRAAEIYIQGTGRHLRVGAVDKESAGARSTGTNDSGVG